jgi:bifunctional non-homologous end joining protein LigD
MDSPYLYGDRSRAWLKFKHKRRQEVVVAGWTEPRAGRQHLGALILGVYQDGRLVHAGQAGGGFTEAGLKAMLDLLQPLETKSSPIDPPPKTSEKSHWVKPQLVVEVEFTEWTSDGSMRHPVVVGLRDDKPAKEVVRETAATSDPKSGADEETIKLNGHNVKVTHRHKIYFPEDNITKGDLIDYYRAIAPTILPYLKDRPESMNRFPNGIHGDSFYHKDVNDAPDWAETFEVQSDSQEKDINYLVCQNEATLIYMINLGCIELNPWNSTTKHPENPDWCVIDLDPEDIGFESVIETAQAVHKVLVKAKIPSYPKTSGATGIHIYIPMGAQYNYDQVKEFAHIVGTLTHEIVPDITSLERSPAKRQGKVYLDYLQNRRGQTLAQAYSVRPRPGATVSTPLEWDEVKPGLTPQQFTIHNIFDRLKAKGDLWKPVLGKGIDLVKALEKLA